MLATTHPALTGTTAQAAKASVTVISGPSRNSTLLAPEGMISSLKKNLSASAMVCSKPKIPTTFGPRRSCTAAQIFLSARMNSATESARTSSKNRITMPWLRVHAQP